MPSYDMLDWLLDRKEVLTIHEDNTACLTVCKTGRNPTMRHLQRVHRVSIAWLHERYHDSRTNFKYTMSEAMAADTFTKAFKESKTWETLMGLIGIVEPTRLKEFMKVDHTANSWWNRR